MADDRSNMTDFNLWLAKNSVKICIAILIAGMTIGVGGNKIIGMFIESQTTEKFDSIDTKFAAINDRITRDESNIEALNKAIQELPTQIADVKIQQAAISSQLVDVITELGRLQTQFDNAFGDGNGSAKRRRSEDITPALATTVPVTTSK